MKPKIVGPPHAIFPVSLDPLGILAKNIRYPLPWIFNRCASMLGTDKICSLKVGFTRTRKVKALNEQSRTDGLSNYIKGFVQEPQKRDIFFLLIFFSLCKQKQQRKKRERGRLVRYHYYCWLNRINMIVATKQMRAFEISNHNKGRFIWVRLLSKGI